MTYEILGALLGLSICLMVRYYTKWQEDVKIKKLTQERIEDAKYLRRLRGKVLARLCEDHDAMEGAIKNALEAFAADSVQANGDYLNGLYCGLEDGDITDKYEAMEHGYECALIRVKDEIMDTLEEALEGLNKRAEA